MEKLILVFMFLIIGFSNIAFAQDSNSNLEYSMTADEQIILFGGFAIAVIAIVLFLARDIIFRKKTRYDKEEFESKKDKTFQKYHSDWTDDYVDFTYTRPSQDDSEFRKAAKNSTLPDYYKILGISRNATPEEIKTKYRELAKRLHPDRSKDEKTKEKMAEINKAYEVLSDENRKQKYDKYLNVDYE